VKDNINIDELFKQGLESFEGNVDPSAWTNIQQGLGQTAASTGAATTGGISTIGKVAAVIGLVGAAATGVWYFSGDDTQKENVLTEQTDVGSEEIVSINEDVQPLGENILVTDTNDPVIKEHEAEIQEDLNLTQYTANDIDDDFLETVINRGNFSSSFIINSNNNGKVDYSADDKNIVDVNNDLKPEDNVETFVVGDPDLNASKEIKCNLKIETEENNTVSFISNAKNHSTVEWKFGDGEIGLGDDVSHTYERPGTYTIKMEVFSDNQSQVVERKVTIEGTSMMGTIPNVFTPNNDGRNDNFFVKSEDIANFYVSIKDERGNEVFTSIDSDFNWNGENRSGEIVRGGYIVVIIAEGEDGQTYKEMKALRLE
jgi:flagellar hook assembly protein FlgD